MIKDRIKELRRVTANQLLPNPKNWRTHPKEQADALRGILAEVGYADALLARELPDGTLMLVDGHLRAETTPGESVPVLVLDVTEEEADKLLVSIDPLAAMAGRSKEHLDTLLASVKTDNEALRAMLEKLSGPLKKLGRTDPDDVPPPPPTPYVKPGEMYELGAHRILCGSSTEPSDVDRLMAGTLADICWTDPPWNVALGEGGTYTAKRKNRLIANDNLGDEFPGFCWLFCVETSRILKPGAPVYLAMSSSEWSTIDLALKAAGFHWSTTIIWAKDSLVLSRRDYHSQYEPIWYGWKEGAARLSEVEDRTQSDLWTIPRPKRSDEHPTMKPVELVARALNNSSLRGATVFEPFSGSGTTILASEMTGRRCRAIELEPRYVQVAIERWEKFTGEKACRVEDRQS